MILGIDTSNYTTSVAVTDNDKLLYDGRIPLTVKQGERGLRQSDTFFQHINNLPLLIKKAAVCARPDAVCVSVTPRRLEGSYMPCFIAGYRSAQMLSSAYGVKLITVSHQEGHIQSGIIGNEFMENSQFIAVHMSGGTTEILLCERDSEGFKTEIIGATKDISAGQFIDRIGVELGFAFPCGKKMDEICSSEGAAVIPISVKESSVYFAGNETKVRKLISDKESAGRTAYTVFKNIADSIAASVSFCCKKYNTYNVLFAGGVSSGKNIRSLLSEKLKDRCDVIYTDANLCTDNAVGVSLLGERLKNGK